MGGVSSVGHQRKGADGLGLAAALVCFSTLTPGTVLTPSGSSWSGGEMSAAFKPAWITEGPYRKGREDEDMFFVMSWNSLSNGVAGAGLGFQRMCHVLVWLASAASGGEGFGSSSG